MAQEEIYFTQEGLEKIKQELHVLKTKRRKEVAERIETAKAMGDLSENAEYQEAKEESAWVEGRILELSDMLSRATVVERGKADIVTIGKQVVIVDDKNKEQTFAIVGANEADPIHGRISSGSPLGVALLGHRAGDEIEVHTPGGVQHYKILTIE